MENKIKIETKPEDRKVMPKYVYVCLAILVVVMGIVYYNTKNGKMYMYSTDFNEDGYAGVGFHCVVNVNSDTDWAIDMGPDGNNPSILVKKIDCENAKLYYESENRMDIVKVYEGYEARVRIGADNPTLKNYNCISKKGQYQWTIDGIMVKRMSCNLDTKSYKKYDFLNLVLGIQRKGTPVFIPYSNIETNNVRDNGKDIGINFKL